LVLENVDLDASQQLTGGADLHNMVASPLSTSAAG
jgi:hypothetical protein